MVGAPAQSVQSFCGAFHSVHASLMSQESEKFPLYSIFVKSHRHDLQRSGPGKEALPAFRIVGLGSNLRPPEFQSIGGNLYRYPYKLITELVLFSFWHWPIRHIVTPQTHT